MTRSGHQEAVARLGAMRLYGDIREGDLTVHCSETAGPERDCGGRSHILATLAKTGGRAGRTGPECGLSGCLGVRPRREAQLQKKTLVAQARDRPDVARRRVRWRSRQKRVGPARLVFIDETWTKTNMSPLRGWGPRGERLLAKVPHRRGRP